MNFCPRGKVEGEKEEENERKKKLTRLILARIFTAYSPNCQAKENSFLTRMKEWKKEWKKRGLNLGNDVSSHIDEYFMKYSIGNECPNFGIWPVAKRKKEEEMNEEK